VYRVTIGAILSITDGVTNIYVLTQYYQNDALVGQANILLAMILTNILLQLISVFLLGQKKSLAVNLREALITLFFLRPAVDAY